MDSALKRLLSALAGLLLMAGVRFGGRRGLCRFLGGLGGLPGVVTGRLWVAVGGRMARSGAGVAVRLAVLPLTVGRGLAVFSIIAQVRRLPLALALL